MKKHLFGALIVLSTLTACTDTDTEPTNPDQPEMTMSLNKTVTYFPAMENFQTRNVKYYDNDMNIVADSTYNGSGNFIFRKIHTVDSEGNYIIDTRNTADVIIATVVLQYDDLNRLTEYYGPNGEYHYSYNENAITVEYRDPSDVFIEVGLFTLNSDGYITSHTELSNDVITNATSLNFSGNTKPVALMAQGVTGAMEQLGTFSYYSNNVPANLQKSTTEINNEVLIANKLEAAALLGNYHLQDFMLGSNSYYHSDTVFQTGSGQQGYPQQQAISIEGQPYCFIKYFYQN